MADRPHSCNLFGFYSRTAQTLITPAHQTKELTRRAGGWMA
uniref:Uncharacterized protein n=1 Tax=Utricularia reniformis TaxID=192314 RepID=A0A1Y0B3C3_9LAMI|nr:hypothetical protein AEK19_MT1666 [Utricularia reniformis]ART31849.1 hypothetical protein AEK19_MT1666 [Utricularia reniformis]